MVVILDLGDGLDEAQQAQYDNLARMIGEEPDTVAVWTASDPVPDGCKPLPLGVLAWVKPDTAAPNPRKDFDHLAKFSSAASNQVIDLGECTPLDILARDLTPEGVELELPNVLSEPVAAFEHWNIDGATYYGYITRGAVLSTVPPPTTPEEIEAFLMLDIGERGKKILQGEIREYEEWARGEVYTVCATNVLTGQDSSLSGCYDSTPDRTYLRTVVDEVAADVAGGPR